MNETHEAFKARLTGYSDEDIQSVLGSLDRERFPDRYEAAMAEIRTRRSREVSGNENAIQASAKPLVDPAY